ncbi:MAG: 5-formyltetrahydrofolate cyclo-ligase family [Anaerocolumna sp.]|jgi:5-formyltetrahydrofolate cyclo-ligase|nr:5-formyltetrahydrofolate cyclo-ligase family [Anaerocolumna sp.]
MDKESIRQEIKQRKEALTAEEIIHKSKEIQRYLHELPLYQRAEAIYCYVSFNQEVRTEDIITQALMDGKIVYVPKIIQGCLKFIEIMSLADLTPGFFGILEPKFNDEILPSISNLVIVPGLAFDKEGRRIGYGKGFYDRFFNLYGVDKFIKVALGYEFQIYEELPEFPSDVKVNMILTENGAYSIK